MPVGEPGPGTESGERAAAAPGGWNVIVTSREGRQRLVRRLLWPLARLKRSGFRNVLVAQVGDPGALLEQVAELCARRPELARGLGKIVPIERSFVVEPARFGDQLRAEAAPFLDRLANRSFHVRIERRGHKGIIHTQQGEQALGEYLHGALEARGHRPVVEFRDPDVVVTVELVGDRAGLALVPRELRQRFPFVRID
jgi:tRNA(Ser,Leu) C12 N-acetylase TAN1